MDEVQFAAALAGQNGLCAICGKPMSKPCIDHNHKTGKVRGLLCHGCNIKLAAIEQVEYRERAFAYLAKYE